MRVAMVSELGGTKLIRNARAQRAPKFFGCACTRRSACTRVHVKEFMLYIGLLIKNIQFCPVRTAPRLHLPLSLSLSLSLTIVFPPFSQFSESRPLSLLSLYVSLPVLGRRLSLFNLYESFSTYPVLTVVKTWVYKLFLGSSMVGIDADLRKISSLC